MRVVEQLLHRNAKRFRGGLLFKAHRWLYHSTLGSRVIKKGRSSGARARAHPLAGWFLWGCSQHRPTWFVGLSQHRSRQVQYPMLGVGRYSTCSAESSVGCVSCSPGTCTSASCSAIAVTRAPADIQGCPRTSAGELTVSVQVRSTTAALFAAWPRRRGCPLPQSSECGVNADHDRTRRQPPHPRIETGHASENEPRYICCRSRTTPRSGEPQSGLQLVSRWRDTRLPSLQITPQTTVLERGEGGRCNRPLGREEMNAVVHKFVPAPQTTTLTNSDPLTLNPNQARTQANVDIPVVEYRSP